MALLDREGISYDQIDVTNDAAGRDALRQRSGFHTVPVIYIDGELIGGYIELNGLKRRGGLEALKAQ
jgi:glutaredoxin 3